MRAYVYRTVTFYASVFPHFVRAVFSYVDRKLRGGGKSEEAAAAEEKTKSDVYTVKNEFLRQKPNICGDIL